MIHKIILISFFSWASFLNAQNRYVATTSMGGDDTNTGTITSPFATVNKALSVMSSGDTCIIREGHYDEEVLIDGKNDIVIMPYMNEWVVFDGTEAVQSNWTIYSGNIYKTVLNKHIWQLLGDQKEMVMARWPNGNFLDKSIYNWNSWASGIVDSANGFPNGSYNGFELVDSTKKDLGSTGLNLTGAIGIMNVGSFKTFNREIISHNPQDNFFSYNTIPNNTYRDKHHHFFVEGKLEFKGLLYIPKRAPNTMFEQDKTICEIADELDPKSYTSREFIQEIGKYLKKNAKKKGSLIEMAYDHNVPIFCPAFTDSSAGFGLVMHQEKNPNKHITIDSIREFRELTEIKIKSKGSGLFMIGGGVPKNFIQDTVICAELLGKNVDMHKYAIQITVADSRDGACSSSTLKEASSWGKVDVTKEQMVFAEATSVLPLIASDAYHNGNWKNRDRKNFSKIF